MFGEDSSELFTRILCTQSKWRVYSGLSRLGQCVRSAEHDGFGKQKGKKKRPGVREWGGEKGRLRRPGLGRPPGLSEFSAWRPSSGLGIVVPPSPAGVGAAGIQGYSRLFSLVPKGQVG